MVRRGPISPSTNLMPMINLCVSSQESKHPLFSCFSCQHQLMTENVLHWLSPPPYGECLNSGVKLQKLASMHLATDSIVRTTRDRTRRGPPGGGDNMVMPPQLRPPRRTNQATLVPWPAHVVSLRALARPPLHQDGTGREEVCFSNGQDKHKLVSEKLADIHGVDKNVSSAGNLPTLWYVTMDIGDQMTVSGGCKGVLERLQGLDMTL